MKCPYCDHPRSRVVDSRPGRENNHIRRRRHCDGCGRRFTTFERQVQNQPLVLKRDGRLEYFDRNKILAAIKLACSKLPVTEGHLQRLVGQVETRMQESRSRKLRSEILAGWVEKGLSEIHPAAYFRYSMVHRQIQDLNGLKRLLDEVP